MFESNPRGAGAAWRQKHRGKNRVHWAKGLSLEQVQEKNRTLDVPYVLHFRVPSAGTTTGNLGTHPFVIDAQVTNTLEGMTEASELASGYVLFHNGFWRHDWKPKMLELAALARVKIPSGPWSDSRGLAWLGWHFGLGALGFTDERIICFGPDDIEVYGAFDEVKQGDGRFFVSNTGWQKKWVGSDKPNEQTGNKTLAAAAAVTTGHRAPGGVSDQATFPRTPHVARTGSLSRQHQSEEVQQTGGDAQAGVSEDKVCTSCKNVKHSGTASGEKWFCWQCWGEEVKKTTPGMELCVACKTHKTPLRVIQTGLPLCDGCALVQQSPVRVFWTYLAEARGRRGLPIEH